MLQPLTLTAIPEEAEALRADIRAFLAANLHGRDAAARSKSWMGFDAEFSRKMGQAGLIGFSLPRRYGGQEKGVFARYVLVEELLCSGAPVSAHWIADRQSAPLILKYGTPEQIAFHLPRICAGESFFCIGMSEPGSGSDLASVRTKAVRHGQGYRVNGRKIWTTNSPHCHYMIALLRTSGTAEDRHQGLSQFIIDLKTPGITIQPIPDLTGEAHFAEILFEDVELGPEALVGQEGQGWEQVTAELAYERSGPERIYSDIVLADRWLQHLRQSKPEPRTVETLGRLVGELAVLRAMLLSITGLLAQGQSPVIEAALTKDLGTSFEQRLPALIAAELAANPDAPVPDDLYRALVYVTQIAPTYSLRGGTREILRGMIGRGLGLR